MITNRQRAGLMVNPEPLAMYEVIGAARGKRDRLFGSYPSLKTACFAALALSRGMGAGGYVGVYDSEGIEIYNYSGTTA